ncbi:MAG: hypothetical protein N3A53_04885 [Verrucomicrobiae bacterium]|nr:hypothetical protein [Verrucomicrobiae bacterium]
MNWFAIHTKPRQESLAQQSLDREGVETYYPKLKRRRTIRRVRRWVIGPLFPGYIFARFDFSKQHRLVRYATGVRTLSLSVASRRLSMTKSSRLFASMPPPM